MGFVSPSQYCASIIIDCKTFFSDIEDDPGIPGMLSQLYPQRPEHCYPSKGMLKPFILHSSQHLAIINLLPVPFSSGTRTHVCAGLPEGTYKSLRPYLLSPLFLISLFVPRQLISINLSLFFLCICY